MCVVKHFLCVVNQLMCVVNTQDAAVNRSEPADIFSPHLSLSEIQAGIRAGRYVQGKFQPSRENCLEAFVNVYDSDEQVCSTLGYCNSLFYGCLTASSVKFSLSRMPPLSFSELDEGTTSRQFFVSCTGFLSRDMSTSNWHVSCTHLCPARHLHTLLTT